MSGKYGPTVLVFGSTKTEDIVSDLKIGSSVCIGLYPKYGECDFDPDTGDILSQLQMKDAHGKVVGVFTPNLLLNCNVYGIVQGIDDEKVRVIPDHGVACFSETGALEVPFRETAGNPVYLAAYSIKKQSQPLSD